MNREQEVFHKEQRLHQLMAETGLDGILLKKQANFSWLTAGGCNRVGIATETGMTSLLITRDSRYIIANRVEMPRMLNEENLAALDFQPLEYEWDIDAELALLRKVMPNLDKVGVDMPFGGLRNLDDAIKKLRYSLTDSEVERYRFLGEKLSAAFEKVMLGIRPGDRECEIAGRFAEDLWRDEIDPTAVLIAADERIYAYRHPIPTRKPVERYVLACINARYKGLVTSITRLAHFGQPSPELSQQFQRNLTIENRMIAATRVGRSMSEVFQTALSAYREFGYPEEWRRLHQGGAMGYYSRDLKVTAATVEIIQENQAFCWNPSITGTKTEDGFIATSAGPLMITQPVFYPTVTQEIGGISFRRSGILIVD
ncbi:MAG: M24 family metallopeptidase [Veillonellaceae bacterium]|nr:M24 family metallopeptidase [Veillonellaceae bacterium]